MELIDTKWNEYKSWLTWIKDETELKFHLSDKTVLTGTLKYLSTNSYIVHIKNRKTNSLLSKTAVLWIDEESKLSSDFENDEEPRLPAKFEKPPYQF